MSEHTSGPWHYVKNHPSSIPAFDIWDDEAMMVAYLGHTRTPGQAEANARLIAAAPDLLAACEAVFIRLHHEQGGQDNSPWAAPVELLRKAIAKAKGE